MQLEKEPWAWAALITIALIAGALFYYLVFLPALRGFAEQDKIITLVPENHWSPIVATESFSFGILNKKGYHLTEQGHVVANINEDGTKAHTVPRLGPIDRWLKKRGFFWLGLESPAILHRDSLELTFSRSDKTPEERKRLPVSQWVTAETITVKSLPVSFPHYVLVTHIDTPDGETVEVLVRVDLFLIVPETTWFVLSEEAFQVIDTEVELIVRNAFEEHSLQELYLLDGEDKAEKKIEGNMPGESGQSLKTERNNRLLSVAGAVFVHITVENWESSASEDYKASLRKQAQEAADRLGELAELETRRQKLIAEQGVAQAEKALMVIQKDTNAAIEAAVRVLAGKNEDLYVRLLLATRLPSGDYNFALLTEALKHTKLHMWNMGGGDAETLMGMFSKSDKTPANRTNTTP